MNRPCSSQPCTPSMLLITLGFLKTMHCCFFSTLTCLSQALFRHPHLCASSIVSLMFLSMMYSIRTVLSPSLGYSSARHPMSDFRL